MIEMRSTKPDSETGKKDGNATSNDQPARIPIGESDQEDQTNSRVIDVASIYSSHIALACEATNSSTVKFSAVSEEHRKERRRTLNRLNARKNRDLRRRQQQQIDQEKEVLHFANKSLRTENMLLQSQIHRCHDLKRQLSSGSSAEAVAAVAASSLRSALIPSNPPQVHPDRSMLQRQPALPPNHARGLPQSTQLQLPYIFHSAGAVQEMCGVPPAGRNILLPAIHGPESLLAYLDRSTLPSGNDFPLLEEQRALSARAALDDGADSIGLHSSADNRRTHQVGQGSSCESLGDSCILSRPYQAQPTNEETVEEKKHADSRVKSTRPIRNPEQGGDDREADASTRRGRVRRKRKDTARDSPML